MLTLQEIEELFVRSDGDYVFARWGRPIAPVAFGVLDEIIFEGIFGKFSPSGKLPFEIPSSMESVENQKEDLPDDTLDPTYEYGYGISY